MTVPLGKIVTEWTTSSAIVCPKCGGHGYRDTKHIDGATFVHEGCFDCRHESYSEVLDLK